MYKRMTNWKVGVSWNLPNLSSALQQPLFKDFLSLFFLKKSLVCDGPTKWSSSGGLFFVRTLAMKWRGVNRCSTFSCASRKLPPNHRPSPPPQSTTNEQVKGPVTNGSKVKGDIYAIEQFLPPTRFSFKAWLKNMNYHAQILQLSPRSPPPPPLKSYMIFEDLCVLLMGEGNGPLSLVLFFFYKKCMTLRGVDMLSVPMMFNSVYWWCCCFCEKYIICCWHKSSSFKCLWV